MLKGTFQHFARKVWKTEQSVSSLKFGLSGIICSALMAVSSIIHAASFQTSINYPDGLSLRYNFPKEPESGLFSELTFNTFKNGGTDFQKTSLSFGIYSEDTKNNWTFSFGLTAAKGSYREDWNYVAQSGEKIPLFAHSEVSQLSFDLYMIKKWLEFSETSFLFSGAAFVLPIYWQKKQTNNLEQKSWDIISSAWNDIEYSRLKHRVRRELDHKMGFDMPRFYLLGVSFIY